MTTQRQMSMNNVTDFGKRCGFGRPLLRRLLCVGMGIFGTMVFSLQTVSAATCPFSQWKTALQKKDRAAKKNALKAMSAGNRECVAVFLKRLADVELSGDQYANLRRVLERAKIPLPSYSGWFKVPKLRKGQPAPHRRVDILASLQAMDRPHGHQRAAMYDLALELTAIVRGLGNMESAEVAEPLARFAFRRAGIALRHEVSRALENLGPYALGGLYKLRAIRVADWKQDRRRYLLQKYGEYMLTVLREGDPRVALAEADRKLKLHLFSVYGRVRVASAARALVDYTDAEDPQIRKGARKALARYFKGPRPRQHRRHLKLPGGVETKDRRLIYMNFRQRALHEIRLELERLTAGNYRRRQPPVKLMRLLFEKQDHQRRIRDRKLLEKALALWSKDKDQRSLALMERILTENPARALVSELAPYYARYGVDLALAGRLPESARMLFLAAMLAKDDAHFTQAFGEAVYVEGLWAEAQGKRARALALHREVRMVTPTHIGARRAIESLEGARIESGHAGILVFTSFLASIGVLWLVGWGIRFGKKRP